MSCVSAIHRVSLLAKERIFGFLLTLHFSEFLFDFDLCEGLNDITYLDVVEVHQ